MESVKVKPEETRNWLALPQQITTLIFQKLGVMEIIARAQWVCSPWRKLAKEPTLYRCMDMRNPWQEIWDINAYDDYADLAREAFKRCNGDLEEFSMENFATDELMYLARYVTCTSLRCLRLVCCYQVSDEALMKLLENNPFLEEVELVDCDFKAETIEDVGRSCPLLKSFRLNGEEKEGSGSDIDDNDDVDEEALAIANYMPKLRRLHLSRNKLTNTGLEAILNGCPYLKYLNLQECFNIELNAELRKKYERIEKLVVPDDLADDYEFDGAGKYLGSNDEDDASEVSNEDYVLESYEEKNKEKAKEEGKLKLCIDGAIKMHIEGNVSDATELVRKLAL
ncbi:hypothetical protein IFM89_035894 [Coptis chinensis]|uniref:F-box domain-containing protein n=1 Tax=Coptis chinensis TaxID=261450 RepID=A0A835LKE9_9MAGN|nr:hypothetical protein IFM89_035894 [Coptis chinensis]